MRWQLPTAVDASFAYIFSRLSFFIFYFRVLFSQCSARPAYSCAVGHGPPTLGVIFVCSLIIGATPRGFLGTILCFIQDRLLQFLTNAFPTILCAFLVPFRASYDNVAWLTIAGAGSLLLLPARVWGNARTTWHCSTAWVVH